MVNPGSRKAMGDGNHTFDVFPGNLDAKFDRWEQIQHITYDFFVGNENLDAHRLDQGLQSVGSS